MNKHRNLYDNLPKCIDLHGLTINNGYNKAFTFIKLHKLKGSSHCKIITGRSGKMRRDFEEWTKNPFMKSYVEKVKTFDAEGSFLVKLRY